jgi:hypothetical protein
VRRRSRQSRGDVLSDFGELCWGHLLVLVVEVAVDDAQAGVGEALGAHVAAGDGPLVVLPDNAPSAASPSWLKVSSQPDSVAQNFGAHCSGDTVFAAAPVARPPRIRTAPTVVTSTRRNAN